MSNLELSPICFPKASHFEKGKPIGAHPLKTLMNLQGEIKGAKFWVFVNIFCDLDLRFQSLLERDLDMVEAF